MGTTKYDRPTHAAIDVAGAIYIARTAKRNLSGVFPSSEGSSVTKITREGEVKWTRYLGPPGVGLVSVVTVDGVGDIYVAGTTKGINVYHPAVFI